MNKWSKPSELGIVKTTISKLKENGIDAELVQTPEEAKQRVLEIIPKGVEVMTMTSVTLDKCGLSQEINESDNYNPVRDKLYAMNRETENVAMLKMGAAPEWTLGSVHAVTQDGHLLIASNTGSQLPAYAYASANVIWVVGTQKIVKNTQEGLKRIYDYVLPLENKRAQEAYGVNSNVSKILIINKEIDPTRLHVIFVNESVGF